VNKVLNIKCSDFVLGVPVLEAVIGGHGPHVVRIPADDPPTAPPSRVAVNESN
jgi:hypothetical protein